AGTHLGIQRIETTTKTIYREQKLFDLELRTGPQERMTVTSGETIAAETEGVAAASWRLIAPGNLDYKGRTAGLVMFTAEPRGRPAVGDIKLLEGQYLSATYTDRILIDKTFAQDRGVKIGDPVLLRVQGYVFHVTVGGIAIFPELLVGSVDDHMTIPIRGSVAGVLLSTEMLKRVVGGAPVNSLLLKIKPGSDREVVRARAIERLKTDQLEITAHQWPENQYSVWCHASRVKSFRDFLPLLILVFVSLTFMMLLLVVQRIVQAWRKEIATLVAFGFTGLDLVLAWSVALYSITLVGALLGTGLAFGLAQIVSRSYADGMGFPILYGFGNLYPLLESWLACGAVILPAILIPLLPTVRTLPAHLLRDSGGSKQAAFATEGGGLIGRIFFAFLRRVHLPYPERMGFLNFVRRPWLALVTAACIAGTMVIASSMYLFAEGQDRGFLEFLDAQKWDALVKFNETGDGSDFFNKPITRETIHSLLTDAGVAYWEPIYSSNGTISREDRSDKHLSHTLVAYPPDSQVRRDGGMIRGKMPKSEGALEITIDLRAALGLKVDLGDTVDLKVGPRIEKMLIVGIMNAFSINQSFVTPGTLAHLTGKPPRITSAFLKGVTSGSSDAEMLKRIAERSEVAMVLPADLVYKTAREANAVLSTFVNLYGHLGSLVGAILILVILSLNIVERAAEYAVMRSFGLTGREFLRSLTVEIFLTAVLAALFSFPLTQVATWLFQQRIMEISVWVPIDHSVPTWLVVVSPAFLVMFISIWPALRMVLTTSEAAVLRARSAG
ncbi:MAG: FtsX-like permease family protein, partial [Bdellovibrionota bacterium]